MSLLLKAGDSMMNLVINSIRNDLVGSYDDAATSLALVSIANGSGIELMNALHVEVQRVLVSPNATPAVRKKAALCLLRLIRQLPDSIASADFAEHIATLLQDRHLGVLTSTMSLLIGMASKVRGGEERRLERSDSSIPLSNITNNIPFVTSLLNTTRSSPPLAPPRSLIAARDGVPDHDPLRYPHSVLPGPEEGVRGGLSVLQDTKPVASDQGDSAESRGPDEERYYCFITHTNTASFTGRFAPRPSLLALHSSPQLLRFLQYYPDLMSSGQSYIPTLKQILARILNDTDVSDSINKSNADHAVLFEAISTIVVFGDNGDVDLQNAAMRLLGKFISVREVRNDKNGYSTPTTSILTSLSTSSGNFIPKLYPILSIRYSKPFRSSLRSSPHARRSPTSGT